MAHIITRKTRDIGNHIPVGPFTLNKGSSQAENLELWYPTVELSTAVWRNRALTGSTYDALPINSPQARTTERGAAGFTPTVNRSLHFLASAIPRNVLPLTISCWTRDSETDNKGAQIVSIGASGDNNHRWSLMRHGSRVYRARTRDTGNSDVSASSVRSVNEWHHVVAVFAADNDRRIYMDGGNKATDTDSRSITAPTVFAMLSTPSGQFSGENTYLTDVRLYSRVPTDHEVHRWYTHPWNLWHQSNRVYFMPAGAAASGISIPAAMANYRRMRRRA